MTMLHLQMFCQEALIWKQLEHPNVLPFLGIDLEVFPGFMCMISPWMQHGTIMAHLEDNGPENIDIDRCICYYPRHTFFESYLKMPIYLVV
jgi:Protein tyrosine and serine/threonine kinase